MGSARWDADDWTSYSRTTSTKSTASVFTARGLHADLDPKNIKVRESRDSALNPKSNAIIVGLDVTGSMGMLADNMVKKGLGVVFEEILKRKPVSDPHLMVMGIGDANCDSAPLQASQFEADLTIAKQTEKIYLEHGGGGNNFESYNLPWYFAAVKTSIDCFEKRGRKGYLFTVGDEEAPAPLTVSQIERFIGDKVQSNLSSEHLLALVQKSYHVFHIVVEEGSHARSHLPQVLKSWEKLLGQNVLRLSDYTKLAEVIVSAIEVVEGKDAHEVAASWGGDTSLVIANSIKGIEKNKSDTKLITML